MYFLTSYTRYQVQSYLEDCQNNEFSKAENLVAEISLGESKPLEEIIQVEDSLDAKFTKLKSWMEATLSSMEGLLQSSMQSLTNHLSIQNKSYV